MISRFNFYKDWRCNKNGKRICHLVKEKYLTRLKHREIALGKKGKEFLAETGTDIKVHCRNPNNCLFCIWRKR